MAKTFLKKLWNKMMGTEEEHYEFPSTLEEFGYKFNEDGELRHIETNEPFQFQVGESHRFNQLHYEALGEPVTEYVYNLMETETKLQRVFVPVDATKEEPTSFIFMSEDALTNPKLLVLIHGSGAVRAGQWTRKLIINNNINIGSQLPYIRQGIKEGYGIIVLNTNLNTGFVNGKEVEIRENECPESHGEYVFENFVMKSEAKCIAVVAHSYGGIVTMELVNEHIEFFRDRVFALAFTDTVHTFVRRKMTPETRGYFHERGLNFAASYDPKNAHQMSHRDDCRAVSGGTDKHEWTSHCAFDLVFDFLADLLKSWVEMWNFKDVRTDHEVLYIPEAEEQEDKQKDGSTEAESGASAPGDQEEKDDRNKEDAVKPSTEEETKNVENTEDEKVKKETIGSINLAKKEEGDEKKDSVGTKTEDEETEKRKPELPGSEEERQKEMKDDGKKGEPETKKEDEDGEKVATAADQSGQEKEEKEDRKDQDDVKADKMSEYMAAAVASEAEKEPSDKTGDDCASEAKETDSETSKGTTEVSNKDEKCQSEKVLEKAGDAENKPKSQDGNTEPADEAAAESCSKEDETKTSEEEKKTIEDATKTTQDETKDEKKTSGDETQMTSKPEVSEDGAEASSDATAEKATKSEPLEAETASKSDPGSTETTAAPSPLKSEL